MTHLQTIQTTNNMSPNIHENSKLQINKHKVMILSKVCNLNKNLSLPYPRLTDLKYPTSNRISYGLKNFVS